MGFHFNPLKAVTRTLGIPDKARPAILTALEVAFPVIALGNELAGKGIELGSALATPKPSQSQSTLPRGYYDQSPYSFNFQAPQYQAPVYGGGGYDAFSLQPQQPYGGSPWGYSTASPTYSTTPYPVYSAPQDRSWEDLTSLAGAVLPFFL